VEEAAVVARGPDNQLAEAESEESFLVEGLEGTDLAVAVEELEVVDLDDLEGLGRGDAEVSEMVICYKTVLVNGCMAYHGFGFDCDSGCN
jgi:hypothetical protein